MCYPLSTLLRIGGFMGLLCSCSSQPKSKPYHFYYDWSCLNFLCNDFLVPFLVFRSISTVILLSLSQPFCCCSVPIATSLLEVLLLSPHDLVKFIWISTNRIVCFGNSFFFFFFFLTGEECVKVCITNTSHIYFLYEWSTYFWYDT